MMALNKVVAKSPTPLADLNMTLTDLGLEAQQLFSGPFGNVDNKNPDELTNMYQSANQQIWWLMTTTELYNSIANQQGLVPTIPGFLNMPFFDKVLMGETPATGAFSLFYHVSEQHVLTQQLRDLKLIMLIPETRRQQRRLGSHNVDIFNRLYVFQQLQVFLKHDQLVNMGAQQAGRFQREAHPGQHQLCASHRQQVFFGEWLFMDLQHSIEANRDFITRRQQDALSFTMPSIYWW